MLPPERLIFLSKLIRVLKRIIQSNENLLDLDAIVTLFGPLFIRISSSGVAQVMTELDTITAIVELLIRNYRSIKKMASKCIKELNPNFVPKKQEQYPMKALAILDFNDKRTNYLNFNVLDVCMILLYSLNS
mgnify:CR=1 FL=1